MDEKAFNLFTLLKQVSLTWKTRLAFSLVMLSKRGKKLDSSEVGTCEAALKHNDHKFSYILQLRSFFLSIFLCSQVINQLILLIIHR